MGGLMRSVGVIVATGLLFSIGGCPPASPGPPPTGSGPARECHFNAFLPPTLSAPSTNSQCLVDRRPVSFSVATSLMQSVLGPITMIPFTTTGFSITIVWASCGLALPGAAAPPNTTVTYTNFLYRAAIDFTTPCVQESFANWSGVSSNDPGWNVLLQTPGFGDGMIRDVVSMLDSVILPLVISSNAECALTATPHAVNPAECSNYQNAPPPSPTSGLCAPGAGQFACANGSCTGSPPMCP
jgi:hypothetical protein